MSLPFSRSPWRPLPVAIATCLVALPVARGDLFDSYRLVRQFDLPAGAEMFDALSDGRVIALVGADVYVETAANSSAFSFVDALPSADVAPFGAAFLRVSPDGQRFAVGNNGGMFGDNYEVGVFNVATLAGGWFAANHFDAEWYSNSLLAITAGDFVNPSIVTVLDTASPDPQNPSNVTIIDNIGGASGGISFDASGNLYTGNGFQSAGPSGTGAVKAFALADWFPVLSGGAALNFETHGTLVVDILSASPLDIDAESNLLVGGGDFSTSNESDFVAVARGADVASALKGSGPVNSADPGQLRRLDPIPANDFNFFSASANNALQQLYVRDFGSDTVFVYADALPIPAVSTWGGMAMALTLLIAGTLTASKHPARHCEARTLTASSR